MTTASDSATLPGAIAPFLSKLTLNPRSRDLRGDLANSQAMHRRVLDAFPDGTSRDSSALLYRIDPVRGNQPGDLIMLTQSHLEPDWSKLPPDYTLADDIVGWDALPGVQVKPVGRFYAAIQAGDTFRFRLRANPTKREPYRLFQAASPERAAEKRRKEGPRKPLRTDGELRDWIVRKGEAHGFQIGDIRTAPDPVTGNWQTGRKRNPAEPDNRTEIEHVAVMYNGILRVTDPDVFRDALRSGIGPGKAYGFGLLSIAPVGQ